MSRLLATLQDSLSKLTIDEWKHDVEAVETNDPNFKILDWSYKGVPPEALTALASALETNSNLTTVLLSGNSINDKFFKLIGRTILANKTLSLEKIDFSFNSISRSSKKLIADFDNLGKTQLLFVGNPIDKSTTHERLSRNSGSEKKMRKTDREREKEKEKEGREKDKDKKTKKRSKKPRGVEESGAALSPVNSPRTQEDLEAIKQLEAKLLELEQTERDYIAKIEELEAKMLHLTKEKPVKRDKGGSLSTLIGNRIFKSLTVCKKNVIITQKLAEVGGSNAGVYSCLVDGWMCAMKELDLSDMNQYSIDSFTSEIRLLELLPQHENISRYLFHESNDNCIRLFMTQYNGSLGSYIHQLAKHPKPTPLPPLIILRLLLDICKGIEFLHAQGIIHRDLKSDNIFILIDERKNVIKCAIGDFDTAKQINSKADAAKTVLGTPAWMAPEVMNAKQLGAYSFPCDVYSFGMILYELMTFKMPFSELNPMKIPLAVLKGGKPEPPDVDKVKYGPLIQLYEDCTQFKASSRPTVKSIKTSILTQIAELS